MELPAPYNQLFSTPTRQWFERNLGKPTTVQLQAWPAISSGLHVLVSAPTGTGKTLAAFLVFIEKMLSQARLGTLQPGLQLVYISPLKALAADIRENLHRPLEGIAQEYGITSPLSTAMRTGDTSTAERSKMARNPPHILITTPESLFLLLTSPSGQKMLKTTKAIVVDELHALIPSKRGAHLMLSLARLDALCGRPLQRVGLSATLQPLELAADYFSNGKEAVHIVAPPMHKNFEIQVKNPFSGQPLPEGTVWPHMARAVVDACQGARSVLAFVEGRLMAEQLAYYVNKQAGEGFARTHHGSVSKQQRLEVENALRAGKLRLLCATSSMELGIDVGEIDRVLQIACPTSISSLMQRLGRAGHNPGRTSLMYMFPRTLHEGLSCALTAQTAREGGIEKARPPRLCLDVLAQHLVSMATGRGYFLEEAMSLLPNAYPFRDVSREDVRALLRMLAGDEEHQRERPVRPRILYNRIHERIEGDNYSRMLATSSPGTIPDTGSFAAKTQEGIKIGELEEEFVFEQRMGFKFLLGSFAWKIVGISKDTVTVSQTSPEGARPPFWRRQGTLGRSLQTGLAFGRHLRQLTEAAFAQNLLPTLQTLGLEAEAAQASAEFIERQLEATGLLPNDNTLIAEHFCDEVGLCQLVIHSVYGRQINAPLALLLTLVAKNLSGMDVDSYEDDDGILLMARGDKTLPEGLLKTLQPPMAKPLLEAALPGTPLFNICFRHNAARALMMGVRQSKRNPLWIQRLRASEMLDAAIHNPHHPLLRETKRECLEDFWDLPGLEKLLADIQSGTVQVRELFNQTPSPMCLPLRRATEMQMMYAYAPTTDKVLSAAFSCAEAALEKKLKPTPQQLERLSARPKLPEDERQLHSLLMVEGDFIAGELPVPLEWFESLAGQGRCLYIEPGLWIAAEHQETYHAALVTNEEEARLNVVRRALRFRGAMDATQLAKRYFWTKAAAHAVLEKLRTQGNVVEEAGCYWHAELYESARRATLRERRQVQTVPASHYAAWMAGRLQTLAPPAEQLKQAMATLSNRPFPASQWEAHLLPARVTAYRPELLEQLLLGGEVFWRLGAEGLCFHAYEDVDWEAEVGPFAALEADEQKLVEVLKKRGASFMSALATERGQLQKPLQEVLFSLMEKGLVHADSFRPVRMWLMREKNEKASTRRQAAARVAATTSGRWALSRPLKPQSTEVQLNRAFEKVGLLCRETASPLLGFSWTTALETLRTWEYTGRARRGYFVEGLSGAQYIREQAYASMLQGLAYPETQLLWLAAADPNQLWGKTLPHAPDRPFAVLQGTGVALKAGVPVAVFERHGYSLRVFDENTCAEALAAFAQAFRKGNVFPALKRLTLKHYPPAAAQALEEAGFVSEMLEYVLYR